MIDYNGLLSDGISIHENYLSCDEIADLKRESLKSLKNTVCEYNFGEAVRIFQRNLISPVMHKIFFSRIFEKIANDFYNGPHRFEAIFITHEYNTGSMAPNGYLHADKDHSLKFMIYLSDVDKNAGPFTYIPNSKKKGAILRNSKNQLRHHDDLQYLKKFAVPVIAKAGTLIIFSTDVIHSGGHITDDNERWIIRSHWRP